MRYTTWKMEVESATKNFCKIAIRYTYGTRAIVWYTYQYPGHPKIINLTPFKLLVYNNLVKQGQ